MSTIMTHAEWKAEAVRRFGENAMEWRFVCPACGHVTKVQDWKDACALESEVAFSCVGRHLHGAREAFNGEGPGPCNYAGGGLIGLNPQEVEVSGRVIRVFAFAPETPGEEGCNAM
jgi:hypothetical protein